MKDILELALVEERQLLEQLEAVRALIRAYGGGPSTITSSQRHGRAPSANTGKIKSLLVDLLRGKTSPTPTRDLLAFLDSEGVEVGGKNPLASLSALLSYANEFESVGRKGWLLKNEAPDLDLSGARNIGGAGTPPVESQKEETPIG